MKRTQPMLIREIIMTKTICFILISLILTLPSTLTASPYL